MGLNTYVDVSVRSCYGASVSYSVSLLTDDEVENEIELSFCCYQHLAPDLAISGSSFSEERYLQAFVAVQRGEVFKVPNWVVDAISFWEWVKTNPAQILKERVYVAPKQKSIYSIWNGVNIITPTTYTYPNYYSGDYYYSTDGSNNTTFK